MANGVNNYCWRCARCNNHFANIENMNGQILIEKKCAKCKSINKLMLNNNEIRIKCLVFNQNTNNYQESYDKKDFVSEFNGH